MDRVYDRILCPECGGYLYFIQLTYEWTCDTCDYILKEE